jgi:hypothetical protein
VNRLVLALAALAALALAAPLAPRPAIAQTTTAGPTAGEPTPTQPAVAIDGARLRLEIVSNGRTPFVQEMVLVTVRGFYTIPIALTKLEVPPMEGFRVLTVGREHWSEAEEDGVQGRGMEQTLALFPQESGTLTIPPIVQRLTIVGSDGKRVEVAIATAATPLSVAPPPADAGAWWLPARRLTLTETWSEPPEALAIGRPVRRVVTLEAEGVTDDQLPPPPVLKADRLIVFSEAPERRTVIAATPKGKKGEALRQSMPRPGRLATVVGRDGPIGRIVYSWAVRPVSGAPAELPEIAIPWFDTEAGEMRTAVLPARTVAFRQTGRSLADLERDIGLAADPGAPARRSPGDVALAALAFLAAATATTALLGRRLVPAGGPLARLLGRMRGGITRRRATRALRRGDEATAWRLYASLGEKGAAERTAVERPLFGGGRDHR